MNELDERNESVKSRNWPRGFAKAVAVSCLLLLAACGDDDKTAGGTEEDAGVIAISEKIVSGVSQKGPFVNGSSVTVQELDGETLTQTGLGFEGKIKSDLGEFSVKVAKLASQYALLKANGFYRNEVTGEKSKSQVTLYALTDLSDRDEVNVNLLTHLTYERSLYLASDGISVGKAKKQAESEVLASFGIDGEFANAEDLDIFGDGEQNAALLAVSVLMQGTLNEADFSERLANYAADIETDGKWDDIKTETQIADWASELSLGNGLAAIRNNIVGWNLSSGVPPFEKYVDIFWWQNYGLGSCVKKREGEVLQADNTLSMNHGVHFICSDGAWRVASDIEKDTYKWMDSDKKTTSKDGDVKYGDVVKTNCYVFENEAWRTGNNSDCSLGLRGCTKLRADTVGLGSDKVWYTCDEQNWRKATTYEKDTFGWSDSTDGSIKKGNVTDSIYVFDKDSWRATSSVEGKLGGCVSAIADSVGVVSGTYYICKNSAWRSATAIEYDTYRWAAGNDGDSKWGSVNGKNCYVFENKAWRAGNNSDCSLELRGCTTLRQDTVGQGSDNVWYTCENNTWRKSTDIEKDTATWGEKFTEGDVRNGSVNTSFTYVFNGSNWRRGTILDSLMVKNGGLACAEKKNTTNGKITVYKDTSSVKIGNLYYVCSKGTTTLADTTYRWMIAPEFYNDTYESRGECINVTDGDLMQGRVSITKIYVCDFNDADKDGEKGWVSASMLESVIGGCRVKRQLERANIYDEDNETNHYYTCYNKKWYDGNEWTWDLPKEAYLNPEIEYDTIIDARDGKSYKTVKIGDQVWMAENLNYADSVATPSLKGRSRCYDDVAKYCDVTGRLYTWAAAIDSVKFYKDTEQECGHAKVCSLKEPVRGNCPENWHLPSQGEWQILIEYVGGWVDAGTKLKSVVGWFDGEKGSDDFGFAVLPAGYCDYNGCVHHDGDYYMHNEFVVPERHFAKFWSSSEFDPSGYDSQGRAAYGLGFGVSSFFGPLAPDGACDKADYASVRCVKDAE